MGYGSSDGGNRVYFTLKVKRGTEVDPHIEVRKKVGSSFQKVDDQCTWIEGLFGGIDFGTYKINEGTAKEKIKNKISMFLVGKDEVYVVQSAMNAHARNLMNTMLKLMGDPNTADKIDTIKVSVYAKNGFANMSLLHNGEFADWFMPYDKQKEYIDMGADDYHDYSRLEEFFLEKWKGAKEFIKQFPVYAERMGSVSGSDQPAEAQATAEAAPLPNDPPPIGEDDDLPF